MSKQSNHNLYIEVAGLIGKEVLEKRQRDFLLRQIKKAKKSAGNKGAGVSLIEQAEIIIKDLNERTGFKYRATDDTKSLINAWLKQGFTIEDFKHVHEVKANEWLGTDNQQFLRPSTLYRKSKFEGYLQQWTASTWSNKQRNETKKANIKKQLIPWNVFTHIDKLSTYILRLDAETRKLYQIPKAVQFILDRLPMARLNRTIPALQEEFEKLKSKELS